MKKDVNLEVIAKKLGVSVVTVSNALSGRKGVSEKTRTNIIKVAKELGYELSQKEKNIFKIGVVVAERNVEEFPSFYMDIYRNITRFVDKKGSLTILEVINENKEKLLNKNISFHDLDVDAIIIIGELEQEFVKWLKTIYSLPIVCLDFYSNEEDIDYFVTNSFRGMMLMTEELITAGHKDIGFVGNPLGTSSIMDRYMGYSKALKIHNIQENEEWIYSDRKSNTFTFDLSVKLGDNLPTSFVCNCDRVAYILIEELKKKGLKVPQDVSVVSFDNYSNKNHEGITLTTYENDAKTLAQLGVNKIMKRLEKGKCAEGIRFIPGKIVYGNTVKKLKG